MHATACPPPSSPPHRPNIAPGREFGRMVVSLAKAEQSRAHAEVRRRVEVEAQAAV